MNEVIKKLTNMNYNSYIIAKTYNLEYLILNKKNSENENFHFLRKFAPKNLLKATKLGFKLNSI